MVAWVDILALTKIVEMVKRSYFWPKLNNDVRNFIESCTIFQQAKGITTNQGIYQPLPIPSRPWESISMDFVMGLPKTKQGFDSVFVIVDRFNKMAHFLSCKSTYDASHIAYLFFKEVVRIHGLPQKIVSDREVKFQGHFWRTLFKKLGTNLSYGSAYHPQTDWQTEVVNRSLGNLLRCLTKQYSQTWDTILP